MKYNKEIIASSQLGEGYEKIVHSSGLTVFVYPKKLTTAYALFATKYGSLERTFSTGGEPMLTVPDGVAHFLEHKLFEEEDGSDVFAKFAALGASANAYTSNEMTAYLFSATDNVEEALEILLSFVTHPHFTEENVAKEQGIIGQEIGMYDDRPSTRLYYALLEGLYQKHNVRVNIAGTVQTISQITPELLYRCYRAFYHPGNMALAVSGDITAERVMAVVDRMIPAEVAPVEIEREYPIEGKEVASEYTTLHMEVSGPLFGYAVKDLTEHEDAKARLRHAILCSMMLNAYFSSSAPFYNQLFNDGLVGSSVDASFESMNSCAYLIITGESDTPDAVFERIEGLFAKIKEHLPTEVDFGRIKKAMYADAVRVLDSTEDIAGEIIHACFHGYDLWAPLEILSSVSYEEFKAFVAGYFADKIGVKATVLPVADRAKGEKA
ncbi:MAG: insulinase family protein [Clostridia bacterium]|nr:insulinase family protein [Clostridia bacterium]